MNVKIYIDRYVESKYVDEAEKKSGTQFEQNATTIKFDFSELDFLDDECVKTIHFFHDSLEENNYIGDAIIENDEFKIPKSITEHENVVAFVQITKENFIWKTKSFDLHFNQSLDVDKTLDEDEIRILQELILEVQQIKTDTSDEYKQLAKEETKKFNDNAASKTESFNENAAARIAEYDEHIEDLDNVVSKNIVSGESVSIDDALAYKVFGAKIDGNAEQTTTTGKNLLKYQPTYIPGYSKTENGVTFTVNDDYSITINGTNNGSNSSINIANGLILQPGTYISNLNGTGWKITMYNGSQYIDYNVARTLETETTFSQVYIEPTSLNKTYDNLTLYPMLVAGSESPGNSEDVYEPYTGGASPNPDYPQEISVVSDEVKIVQTGKNLFNTTNKEYNLASLDIDISNNELLINGTSTGSTGKFVIADNLNLKTSNYIFSFFANKIIPNLTFEFYDLEDNLCKFESANNKMNGSIAIQNQSIKKINAYSNGTQTFSHEIKLQIEEGTVASEYETYKSNKYTIDLNDNELVKLNNIKDTIEIDKSGNVNLNKKIGKISLAGTENISLDGELSNVYRFICYNVNSLLNYENAVISNYLINERNYTSDKEHFYIGTNNAFLFMKKDLFSSKDNALVELKQMLSINNMIIYSDLIEPTTSSLGTVVNFKTYEGVNHFFLEANLATNFEIKYAQDLQKVISKQQEEIDELKTLLSSTATSAMLLDNYANDLVEEV